MKHYLKIIIVSIVLGFISLACSSGKKMLEEGNYYQAVLKSVERLKNSPSNSKARETLVQAYPFAVENLLDRMENNSSNNKFRYTDAVYIYNDLNYMYESIKSSPAALGVINYPKKFYGARSQALPKAAEEQYLAGIEQLSFGDRNSAKMAYFYFLEADKFVKNYKDVDEKTEIAFNLSVLKVISDLKSVQSRLYDLSAEVFYKQVNKTLRQIEQNEFIRFYSPEEAKMIDISTPDQYLTINFEDFIVGETHTSERIASMKSDSVQVSVITLDNGRKREVFDVVTAEVSINRMEVISKGIINLSINENTAIKRDLINLDLAGEYVWFNEWGFYNGDERALTKDQIAICSQKRLMPLPPQQMFVEFTKPIHAQVSDRLVNFYKNY